MGDAAIKLLSMTVKAGFIIGLVTSFVIVLNIAYSLLFVTLNAGALTDLFGLVQLWLPFNLSVVIGWLFTASIAYVFYRLMWFAITVVDVWVG